MYDPLIETHPQPGQPYPASYWASHNPQQASPHPLSDQQQYDVAIIGGGYAGMSAAYHLAANHNASVCVLEANQVAWGCSGRNAGFVLPGTGRLSFAQLEQKFGLATSQAVFAECQEAVSTVSNLISASGVDCEKVQGGYLKIAHSEEQANKMRSLADTLCSKYQDQVEFVREDQIRGKLLNASFAKGGLYYSNYFAVNPLKLALGYHTLLQQHTVPLFTQSPVIDWQTSANRHQLITPQGSVSAEKVIIATNGYTGKALHPLVNRRHFPVLTSVIVTTPLTEQQRARLMMREGLMAMDTRSMKYYYRLLPDNRLLFGGRGAIKGADADKAKYRRYLLEGLKDTFPDLGEVSADYFWSGWVSVSFDDMPRIFHSDDNSIFYAMGYCGSGLAFSTQAGKRLAQKVVGSAPLPDLPYYGSALPRFPLAAFRRWGLRAFYAWARLRN